MRSLSLLLSSLLLVQSAGTPFEAELIVTKKVLLSEELEDLAGFGGPKESTCDLDGNIFTPTTRKYGSAINSILRIAPDGRSYTQFSIDQLQELEDGHIVEFILEPSGDIYVLARQVRRYSEYDDPIEFGKTFVVHYDTTGSVVAQVQLALDAVDFQPTGLAVLGSGDVLIVGTERTEDKLHVLAKSFRADGSPGANLALGSQGTKPSKAGHVGSTRVVHPAAIKTNGLIYVVRGSSNEPVYVLGESGELLRTIRLKRPGLEFDSPHVFNNELIVHEHRPIPDEAPGIRIRVGRERINLPVFNLETGEVAREYYWYEGAAALACFTREGLTFIGQDGSSFPSRWAILYTRPAGPERKEPDKARGFPSSLNIVVQSSRLR